MRTTIQSGPLAIVLALMAGCGGGPAGPAPSPGGEYETGRGADFSRAAEHYRAGRKEEGARILRELASSREPAVRVRALQVIGDTRDPALLPELHRALGDENLEVRESASRALQWMGDATSMDPLRGAIEDPEAIIRRNAAEALARVGGAGALPELRKLLTSDPDPGVRAMTAAALGGVRDEAVVEPLAAALADASALVRARAAEALGEAGYASGRAALSKAASGDPDEGVRSTAAAALSRLGG